MHYLGLAIYAEGAGDYLFLRPLLQRLCEDICIREAERAVEVSDVIPINHDESVSQAARPTRVVNAAHQHSGAWRLLFVHGDAGSCAIDARANLVQPSLDALQLQFPSCAGVAVVPIRETEAWAICDGDALRQVFCTSLSDSSLGLPAAARMVESNADPKQTLDNAFLATEPPPQRRRQGTGSYLNAIGDAVSLLKLRALPGFRSMESELTDSLRALGVFR